MIGESFDRNAVDFKHKLTLTHTLFLQSIQAMLEQKVSIEKGFTLLQVKLTKRLKISVLHELDQFMLGAVGLFSKVLV